jgi:hypothetical protein
MFAETIGRFSVRPVVVDGGRIAPLEGAVQRGD